MFKASADIAILLTSCVTTSGTTAVGLAGVMDTGGGSVFSEGTLIPFGLFLAGLAMTSTLVWKVATHKAGTEMRLKELVKRMERIEESFRDLQERKHREP